MASLPLIAHPVRTVERPLQVQLRRRHDLRFQQTDSQRWNVLDPLTRQNYRIGLVEHWLLTRVDGKLSVTQLFHRLRGELPNVRMSDEQLLGILAALRSSQLLWLSEPNVQPAPLASPLNAWLSSVVVWQIRGLQPDRWLAGLAPHTDSLFSKRAVRCWLLACLVTSAAVLLDFHRLSVQSLSLNWILQPNTSGMLFVVFILTRALHELGHALVCKRFGIRCPDIGLFVILGAPCVYCDVSESWQLPRRWQRAAVAAAGMYVELVVATLAAWIWLVTLDGPVNTLALQTMIVCSISTVVINANPLMRFDGYYLLADCLDEAHLRGKADRLCAGRLRRFLLGGPQPANEESLWRYRFLLIFSLAGWIYRALLSVTIATVLVNIYSAWNLQWIGRFLAAAILVSWWGVPTVKFALGSYRTASQFGQGWRLAIWASLLVFVFALLPLPSRRFASGWLQPLESRGVYVGYEAKLLASLARDGQHVPQGLPLFQLESRQSAVRLVRYRRAVDLADIRLQAVTRRRDLYNQDMDLKRYETELEEAQSWTANLERELRDLTLLAPISGRLIAMPAQPPLEVGNERLGGPSDSYDWGTWCDDRQMGRRLPAGAILASVCSQEKIAVLPLGEAQLKTVAAGTRVRLSIPQSGSLLRETRVTSVVQLDELASPWQSAALASMASSSALANRAVRFAAVVRLPVDFQGLPGSTVDAVFVGKAETIATALTNWLSANLRLLAD